VLFDFIFSECSYWPGPGLSLIKSHINFLLELPNLTQIPLPISRADLTSYVPGSGHIGILGLGSFSDDNILDPMLDNVEF